MKYQGMMGKHSDTISSILFIIGLIGAIFLRFVLIANYFNTFLAKVLWYIAMTCFVVFYYYRYVIEDKRRKLITESNLRKKLERKQLEDEDYKALSKTIDSLLVSKVKLNYVILFIFTIIALVIQVYLDFYR